MEDAETRERAEAALFDCDGLLVATEDLFTIAERAIFDARGAMFTGEHKAQVLGWPIPEVGRRMASMLDLPDAGRELADELLARVEALIAQPLEPLAGVLDLLDALHDRVPCAVVSNSPRSFVEATLTAAGLAGRFDTVITVEDAANPKPAPDLYLRAATLVGVEPARCLAFEDSATGARAARAAGIPVIGVPHGASGDIGADWHVPSLDSLAARALIGRLVCP